MKGPTTIPPERDGGLDLSPIRPLLVKKTALCLVFNQKDGNFGLENDQKSINLPLENSHV